MSMIEVYSERKERGGISRAVKDFKESLECLKEDFYAVMEEFEELGERNEGGSGGGSNRGGGSRGGSRGGSMGYRDEEDEYYWKEREREDEEFGERRGVRGSGRRRRSNGRYY